MKAGLIGIGSMGMAMALNLHRKGLQVFAHDIRTEAMQAATAAGIAVCASPAELAQNTELIIVVVVNAKQVNEVLFGNQGVTSGPCEGNSHAVPNHCAGGYAGHCGAIDESGPRGY